MKEGKFFFAETHTNVVTLFPNPWVTESGHRSDGNISFISSEKSHINNLA